VAAAHARPRRARHRGEADHHGVVDRGNVDAVAGQHVEIVLDVLPDLQHRIASSSGLSMASASPGHLRGLFGEHVGPAVAQRDVAGLIARPERKADPDQIGADRVERAGLGIDRHQPRGAGAGDPFVPAASSVCTQT
jgi:hypothetical protein